MSTNRNASQRRSVSFPPRARTFRSRNPVQNPGDFSSHPQHTSSGVVNQFAPASPPQNQDPGQVEQGPAKGPLVSASFKRPDTFLHGVSNDPLRRGSRPLVARSPALVAFLATRQLGRRADLCFIETAWPGDRDTLRRLLVAHASGRSPRRFIVAAVAERGTRGEPGTDPFPCRPSSPLGGRGTRQAAHAVVRLRRVLVARYVVTSVGFLLFGVEGDELARAGTGAVVGVDSRVQESAGRDRRDTTSIGWHGCLVAWSIQGKAVTINSAKAMGRRGRGGEEPLKIPLDRRGQQAPLTSVDKENGLGVCLFFIASSNLSMNRVWLPILLVVSWTFPCPRSRISIWSRDIDSVVPSRVSPHPG